MAVPSQTQQRPAASAAAPASRSPGNVPPRVMPRTVAMAPERRQRRFRSGVRDLVFGLAVVLAGVVLSLVVPQLMATPERSVGFAGWALAAIGLAYAAWGASTMVRNRPVAAGRSRA